MCKADAEKFRVHFEAELSQHVERDPTIEVKPNEVARKYHKHQVEIGEHVIEANFEIV